MDEAQKEDLSEYPSLMDLFIRPLKSGARPIDGNADVVACADGQIIDYGCLDQQNSFGQNASIKGLHFDLATLIGIRSNNTKDTNISISSEEKESNSLVSMLTSNPLASKVLTFIGLSSANAKESTDNGPIKKSACTDLRKRLMKDPINNDLFYYIVYLAPGDHHLLPFKQPTLWPIFTRMEPEEAEVGELGDAEDAEEVEFYFLCIFCIS